MKIILKMQNISVIRRQRHCSFELVSRRQIQITTHILCVQEVVTHFI